jgi:hypothetical protein
MTYENYIKAQLVRYSVDEAYHMGGIEPVLAVAQTLKNRVDAGWQGGDWLRVIETAPDFVGTVRENPPVVEARSLNFRRILQSIDDVYYGIADTSNVNNDQDQKSLYYAELHNLNRSWFKDNILSDHTSHPRIAKVGQFDFFA